MEKVVPLQQDPVGGGERRDHSDNLTAMRVVSSFATAFGGTS